MSGYYVANLHWLGHLFTLVDKFGCKRSLFTVSGYLNWSGLIYIGRNNNVLDNAHTFPYAHQWLGLDCASEESNCFGNINSITERLYL